MVLNTKVMFMLRNGTQKTTRHQTILSEYITNRIDMACLKQCYFEMKVLLENNYMGK